MKKFKDISNLQAEVMRLRIRELELEKQLHKDWLQVKDEIKPSSIIKNHFAGPETTHWLLKAFKVTASTVSNLILRKEGRK
jgi:hypothetical protein